jgi:hypothetical protein
VNAEGMFKAAPWLLQALQLLAASGVHGVAMDVWVGGFDAISLSASLHALLPFPKAAAVSQHTKGLLFESA